MPIRPQRPFEHEATLEELAGFGKKRRFDAVIDDEEVEVILPARGFVFPFLGAGMSKGAGCPERKKIA